MPVANIGTRKPSLQNAVAMNASAITWVTAPTAAHRAPRTHGGEGALASGLELTTCQENKQFILIVN